LPTRLSLEAQTGSQASPLIEFRSVVKVYPPNVMALDHASASFRQGEIHAIVGENGAGKSTLMKALYGLAPRDAGEILLRGRPVQFNSPGEAIAAGIGMVHQEFVLIPEYSVWENVVLGLEPAGPFGRLQAGEARRQVQAKIDEYGLRLEVDALVGEISVAARQKVEILKLLYREVSVLILDEPTSVLTPQEVPALFGELRRLRESGRTILFISHRLDEVLDLSDRITVMRKGRVIDTVEAEGTTKEKLAQMMVGREVVFTTRRKPQAPGEVVFRAEGLSCRDANGQERLRSISLEVRAGEVVGIAGVEGNGQFELVNLIMGLAEPSAGSLRVDEQDLTRAEILERRRSISFVPQDRGRLGASLDASILEDAIMTHHRLDPRFTRWKGLLLNWPFARNFTERLRRDFSVNMARIDQPFRSLSGGNQQKVILGRELLSDTPFLLLDQPTRGLDVGSIEYVHGQILRMRAEGKAVLLISADLEELFLLSDRIVVLHRGQAVTDLPVEEATVETVGLLMLEGRE
jgi:simple sugar transport system ATP-binding protein